MDQFCWNDINKGRLCLHDELLNLKLQIGKCKLKILFFQFSFFNYFTRSLRRNFLLSLRAPKVRSNLLMLTDCFVSMIIAMTLFNKKARLIYEPGSKINFTELLEQVKLLLLCKFLLDLWTRL